MYSCEVTTLQTQQNGWNIEQAIRRTDSTNQIGSKFIVVVSFATDLQTPDNMATTIGTLSRQKAKETVIIGIVLAVDNGARTACYVLPGISPSHN